MNTPNKLWIWYAGIGFICSLIVTYIFNSIPQIALLSNEAVVFGLMTGAMGLGIKSAFIAGSKSNATLPGEV